MSIRSSGRFVKSSSEGELLDRSEETQVIMVDQECGECLGPTTRPNNNTAPRLTGGVEPKLKRTFTLPRNPFSSSRMSKRRAKHKDGNKQQQQEGVVALPTEQHTINGVDTANKKKVFRRPSFRKFFNKMVQHVSSVNVPSNKNINNMDKRRSSTRDLSLSSNDIRVPPMKPAHLNFGNDKVPGVIGLRNHGNTCFINAVLQCLSHTDILAEYFVLDQYKVDLSRRNKLNSKKYGTKGEVTEQLATLLKSIWSCQYAPEISNQFKEVVDKYGSQYRGAHQHDAQEFLLWLLDKVHEDLNTATKKKYKAIKNSFGRPDDVVAEETLANHKRCNNSFVHALFQAQFRSSLTCPKCHSQSNTFDPFLCVSIPVPQKQKRPLYVTVLYLSQQPREVRFGLSLPHNAEVRELREQLASDTGISEQHMLLTEIDDLSFLRTFADSQSSAGLRDTDPLYCIELPQLKEASEESGAYVLLCWVNVLQLDDHCSRFGSPYTMQVGRETSYEDLQKLILKEMNTILHDDVLVNSQEVPLFRMRVAEAGLPAGTYLDPTLDHPLYMEAVDQALALCQEDSGPAHLKLVLEWDSQGKESIIADEAEQVEELASVKQLRDSADQAEAASLEECFELYTREEVLGPDDAWHCPYCNRKQEVVKKLGLWSLPDILVIHLKRFRQSSKQRSTAKLTTLVDFPLYGFDMSAHLARRARGAEGTGVPGGLGWSPWKRPRRQTSRHEDNVYDLYAICNHHGQDLQGGHYTAYCRNPYDGNWYAFDDTRVETVSENSLMTPSAYILFYQHRSLSTSGAGSSSASSSSSSEHWVYRMPAFDYAPPPTGSKSNEEISNKAGSADEAAAPKFQRGSRGYATLQPNAQNTNATPVSGETDHYSDDEAPLASKRGWSSPEVGRRASSVPREAKAEVSTLARVASPETSPISSSAPPSPTIVTESSV